MNTWVLIGDSIMSAVSPSTINGPAGTVQQMTASLLQNERGICIRNLSSPGASLGAGGAIGYANITPTLDVLAGIFGYVHGIIVTAGTNDFGTNLNPAQTADSLRRILAWGSKYKRKVLVMDLPYRQKETVKNKIGHALDSYRWVRGVVCNEYKTTARFATREGTPFATFTPSLYDPAEVAAGGALHLNAAGNRAFADWIKAHAAQGGLF